MMAGRTPNLDRIAAEGMLFTDYYAEASCTAGRAQLHHRRAADPHRMTTVGQAGATTGLPAEAVTIATALKAMGYATASSARTTSAIATSSCPRCTGSTSSSAISITWTRWKTPVIQTIRKI